MELNNESKVQSNREKGSKNPFRKLWKKISNPIGKTLKDIDENYADRSPAKRTLIALFKMRAPICIFLAAVILLTAGAFLYDSSRQATVVMSLNYEESAKGLTPNSTRFNASDLKDAEVVEGMLRYCGIDPESVDVAALADSISIKPTNSKGFSKDDYYIATSYRVTLKKPSSIHGVSIHDMIEFLCKSYKDTFYKKYTENRAILDFDIGEFNDVEFMEIADLLDLKAMQLEKYLATRVKEGKTFTEESSNETFKSLSQKVEALQTYDIGKYRAFVLQAGLSHNKTHYTRALDYVNRVKTLSYDKDMAAYDVRNEGIILYNEAMISVVMIPSIDINKNTYYMSKTKTGMDYMAAQADDYLLTAQETSKEIAVNKDIITKMAAGTNSATDVQKAGAMIESMRQKFTDLSKQVESVDKAYVRYKTKDYVTFKLSNTSLLQRLQPDVLIILLIVLALVIFSALWLKFRYSVGGGKK